MEQCAHVLLVQILLLEGEARRGVILRRTVVGDNIIGVLIDNGQDDIEAGRQVGGIILAFYPHVNVEAHPANITDVLERLDHLRIDRLVGFADKETKRIGVGSCRGDGRQGSSRRGRGRCWRARI